jgi:hypothetical protein
MSDPNINIKITTAADTTGADAAKAALDKVTEAGEEATTRGFGGMMDGTVPRLDEVAESMEEVAKKAEEMVESLPDLTTADVTAEAADRMTSATEGLGGAAVATGGRMAGLGRALVALAGGPVGIAVTAISAILGLVQRWKRELDEYEASQKQATDSYLEFQDEIRSGLREMEMAVQLQDDLAASSRRFDQQLASTLTGQSQINEAIRANIELLKEKQAGENEIAKAKGDTEVAEAEGDPLQQEQIRNRLRKEAQARELRQLEEEQRAKQDLLNREEARQMDILATTAGLAEQKKAAARALAADAANKEALAKSLRFEEEKLRKEGEELKGSDKGSKQAALNRDADALGTRAQTLEDAVKTDQAEADALAKEAEETTAKVKKEVDAIVAEMNRLFQEISKIERTKDVRSQVFQEENRQGEIRETRVAESIQTSAVRKQEKEADDARRDAERDALARQRAEAAAGRDAVSLIPKGVSEKARAAVEAAAASLQDGDQGGEVERLLELVSQMAGYVQRSQGTQSAQATKISQLEARIKELK